MCVRINRAGGDVIEDIGQLRRHWSTVIAAHFYPQDTVDRMHPQSCLCAVDIEKSAQASQVTLTRLESGDYLEQPKEGLA
jgi:23S rRNA U2552 (ribose-2'-O)-methylase RlmE/FtsJ